MLANPETDFGIAFVAGNLESLDADATISVINKLVIENYDWSLDPESYQCPVVIEEENGDLRSRYLPKEIGRLATFLSQAKGNFADKAKIWFEDCAMRNYPAFVKVLNIKDIIIKP